MLKVTLAQDYYENEIILHALPRIGEFVEVNAVGHIYRGQVQRVLHHEEGIRVTLVNTC